MTTPTPDRTPTGDLRERLAEALHQHTIATGLPTPFPPDFPEDPWLEAARRADQSRADAVLPVVEAALAEQARLTGAEIAARADSYRVAIRQLEARVTSAEAALGAKDAEIERLRDDLKWTRSECAKADAENRAAGSRAEQAEAAVQRVRDLAEAALEGWKPDCEYHRERADRKGYSHDEAAADALGRAIEAVTEMRAALDQPKEPS